MFRAISPALLATFLLALSGTPLALSQMATSLPEGAQKKSVTIYSDGIKMAGDLYFPADFKKDDKRPAVIFCNGTGGTRKGTPTKLATHLLKAGYVFLAFDYRGWGDSDGKLMPLEALPKPGEKGESPDPMAKQGNPHCSTNPMPGWIIPAPPSDTKRVSR